MKELQIQSNIHTYAVHFADDLIFLDELASIEKKVLIVDKNVFELHKELFSSRFNQEDLMLFEAIEENKNLESVMNIYRFLTKRAAKRNMTVVSVGGGITQDVTGFASATLYRGVKWIFLPTTFLAQTDSCIGSKTSLNFESYKNIIGGFYPPHHIYIYPPFLETLSKKDFYSGMGEVIKFQLLREVYPTDVRHVVDLVEGIKKDKTRILPAIHDTMQIKIAYMTEDEFDTGKRNLLNYGHCFGHAIETASHYEIPHGLAVVVGMIFANIVSYHRGYIGKELYKHLNRNLFFPNIPLELRRDQFDRDVLLKSMENDKKREGNDLTLVMPSDNDLRFEKFNDFKHEEFDLALSMLMTELELE